MKEITDQLADIRDGAEPNQLPPSKPKPKRKKAEKPKPIAHNSDIHSSNLEVELTDLPEEDGSSTIPLAEEGASGDNASAVVDEGCMEEDEEEEDSSGSGEAVYLKLEAVVYSDQPLPILSRGKAEVDTLSAQ